MKKISLIILESEKKNSLKKLRKLGLVHIEEVQGGGTKLASLKDKSNILESSLYVISDKSSKKIPQQEISTAEALQIAEKIAVITDEKKKLFNDKLNFTAELKRLKEWGDINPSDLKYLSTKGVELILYEMPLSEYKKLDDSIQAIVLQKSKKNVKIAVAKTSASEESLSIISSFKLQLPRESTAEIKNLISRIDKRIDEINIELKEYSGYSESLSKAVNSNEKDIEFETYLSGISTENIDNTNSISVAYFTGFIPTEDLENLKNAASENAWGLIAEDPTEEDNVPTKLKNNKLISLIYPLTDFLGTVPGYFEYDISGWFLGFILIFFGIIFGDGGYGLLICAVAGLLIFKNRKSPNGIPPTFILILLLGGATVLWGTLTCTWFGLLPDNLPDFLKALSLPFISNVYADKIWYPFWTNGEVGLTTAQNLQIFCFSLALVQLTVAHIMGAVRNRKSFKILGDIGSILQLVGIFYVVLTLVVNGEVFGLERVINGIPVGTLSIALVGVGFLMSFIFANYQGSIKDSVLDSCKNIVSVLLGVVNVFSDIVSYIRLWAVGLAGAAISATVNELAGPMFGKLAFIIFAIILLFFGHGLNMILNVLSVIVHGVRLNTLEFSTHLDMSWSGHKYSPFKE